MHSCTTCRILLIGRRLLSSRLSTCQSGPGLRLKIANARSTPDFAPSRACQTGPRASLQITWCPFFRMALQPNPLQAVTRVSCRQAGAECSRGAGPAADLAHSAGHQEQRGGVEGGRQRAWPSQECDQALPETLLAQVSTCLCRPQSSDTLWAQITIAQDLCCMCRACPAMTARIICFGLGSRSALSIPDNRLPWPLVHLL